MISKCIPSKIAKHNHYDYIISIHADLLFLIDLQQRLVVFDVVASSVQDVIQMELYSDWL